VKVSELSPSDRPREKLLERGAVALSEAELLAVLLRTGRRGEPVLDLARAWLTETGGLAALARLDVRALLLRPGVGPAKGAMLAAALELGRRLAREALADRPVLDRPELVADVLVRGHARERVELFGVLTLDTRHRLLREHTLHRGARAHSEVEPGEVFHEAILDNAHAVVIWHTHPSGDPSPSADDVELTRRLVEAGRLLNVAVLDHIVVARSGWVSLRQRGVAAFA
jgi:DNA repair protein RadC